MNKIRFDRITCLTLATLTSGCTLSSLQKPASSLTIQFPSRASRLQARAATPPTGASSLADLTCYGVKVTASDIPDDPRLGCTDPDGVEILAGLVPTTGGSLRITVPTGAGRKVEVFGLVSAEGCPTLDTVLARPAAVRFVNFSPFYNLGASTVDVVQDASVSVSISFNGAATPTIFSACGGFAPLPSPTPSSSPSIGGWKIPPTIAAGFAQTLSGSAGGVSVSTQLVIGTPIIFGSLPQATGGTGATQIILRDGAVTF